jgi:hypothetical protein
MNVFMEMARTTSIFSPMLAENASVCVSVYFLLGVGKSVFCEMDRSVGYT